MTANDSSLQHSSATPKWWLPHTWRWERLFEPVDAASLAMFRIWFGLLMVWEVWRYWDYGWIKTYFVDPTLFFRYPGFGWLPAPSPTMAYVLWGLMAVGAAGTAVGLLYRFSVSLMTLIFVYFFLLDSSNYLNHFYLISLLGGLMMVLPADRIWSIDAWRRGEQSQTIPAWCIWLLRLQVGIPYFFGGIAKLDRDWLLSIPMQQMLFQNLDLPIVGRYMFEWWTADLFALGGFLFDLLVVPFLFWKRTRTYAYVACLLFHLTNKLLLNIGVFPWMMIAATTIFFEPDWPRRLPGVPQRRPDGDPAPRSFAWTTSCRLSAMFFCVWLLIQFTVPLRRFVYEGNSNWTEVGHRFAWRMKLRSKEALARFYVVDPQTGEVAAIDPRPFLTLRQLGELSQHPEMILQFARFLDEQLEEVGLSDHEVHAEVWCSLNDRDPQLLIDPTTDLTQAPGGLRMLEWILPLEEPRGDKQTQALQHVRELQARVQSSSELP